MQDWKNFLFRLSQLVVRGMYNSVRGHPDILGVLCLAMNFELTKRKIARDFTWPNANKPLSVLENCCKMLII